MVRRPTARKKLKSRRQVCANVFGLWWSLAFLATMSCTLVGTDRLSMSCISDLAAREIVGRLLLGSSRVCVCFNVNLDIDIGCR